MTKTKTLGLIFAGLYALTVILANVAFEMFGVVPVGFGLVAPAAVLVAGAAFIFRDYVHEYLGVRGCLAAIAVGAGLSVLVNPTLALASGAAFLFSELADLMVFSKIREKGFVPAVLGSNAIGVVLDSVIFLTIAFGSLAFFWGQILGKVYATAIFLVVVGLRAARRRVVAA